MELREGYKQTEVGLIPDDWQSVELNNLTRMMTNGFVGTAKSHYTESRDGITYIQGFNVEENSFNFRGIKKVTPEFHAKQSKSRLKEKDLLMVQTGDVGLTTFVSKELEGSNCHALIISRFKNGSYDSKFFSFYLNSASGRSRLKELETGTTMKHINVGDLKYFQVPLPPTKAEQTAIATALSDVDALITQLEKLIIKKRHIKQGAMQTLLNPFDENGSLKAGWEKKTLGELVDFLKGNGLSKEKLSSDGKYPCVLYGELYTTYNEVISKVISHTDVAEGLPSKNTDILMPGSTTTSGIDLAIATAILKENILLGGDINVLRIKNTNECNSMFLAYLLTHTKKEEILKKTQGITIIHLYGKSLNNLQIVVPEIEIQKKTVQIFVDMDLEITALESKLAKTKKLKQGMMQQLLTGKIRLVDVPYKGEQ